MKIIQHIYIIIGLGNDFTYNWCQAITLSSDALLSIGPFKANFNEFF